MIHNKENQKADETEFLGIAIDQHLTGENHIDYVTKITKPTAMLCRIRFYVSHSWKCYAMVQFTPSCATEILSGK